ncbi:unnamed protein product [Effrenium voratum]|uniref:EF-hand domain-containing protein n=1 Tax=Effrenium voratum TaxID=2562239 RepID=A0AA36J8H5_9DINO|nr:unnamed protein product [Effrenium voratum]
MTTVGYGDFVPRTAGGYIIVSILTLVSALFVAMPVGIIGHEFTLCWQGRDQVLCITRARRALLKWGYTAQDVRALFEYVDADRDACLDMAEFLELFRQMRIGLSLETTLQLFCVFDDDQSGQIDYTEFMRHVFPQDTAEADMARRVRKIRKSSQKVTDALAALENSRGVGRSNGALSPASDGDS